MIAGDGGARLAVAAWLILAARAIASIPFVRTQIARLHHGTASLTPTDTFQVAAVVIALAAVVVDERGGPSARVPSLCSPPAQVWWTRRRAIPAAKVIGLTQMGLGVALVAATAVGTLFV